MTAATPEGQREIIWLYIAATHPSLTDDKIGWAVSKLGLEADSSSRLTEEWKSTFEKASADRDEKVTLTSDRGFERDLGRILTDVPSQEDFQLGAFGQAGRDARGGLLLGYGVVGLGVVAGTGGAALGALGALGGDLVLGGSLIEGGGLAGGETASFGSLAATGARYVGTQLYLNAPALYSSALLAYGAYQTEEAATEHITRIRSEGFHWRDIPEFAGDLAPFAEGAAPFIPGRSPSGTSAPGSATEPAEPDLVITRPLARDPDTGRVTGSLVHTASGRQFDAEFDPESGIGQIVDRRSRAVVGIIRDGEISRPAPYNLAARESDVAPGPATTPRPTAPDPVVSTEPTGPSAARTVEPPGGGASVSEPTGGGGPLPRLRGATAEGVGPEFHVEYHPPVAEPSVESRRPPGLGREPLPLEESAGGADIGLFEQEHLGPELSAEEIASSEQLSESMGSLDSIEAARQAGVPDLVYGDGTVLTLADFPDLIPHPLARPAYPAPPTLPTTGRTIGLQRARNTRLGGRLMQDLELRADLRLVQDALEGSGARIIRRMNQRQVYGGHQVDVNRPDLALVIIEARALDGRRIFIEYDRAPGSRSRDHAERILSNDPDAIVILKIVDFESGRRRTRRP